MTYLYQIFAFSFLFFFGPLSFANEGEQKGISNDNINPPYCLAIRGNGEAQPAHWGALARLVEERGLPIKQSGGSSGALSSFLLENLAKNPWISQQEDFNIKKSRAAFLIKTFHGIFNWVAKHPKVAQTLELGQWIQNKKETLKEMDMGALSVLARSATLDKIDEQKNSLLQILTTLKTIGVGQTEPYQKVFISLEKYLSQPTASFPVLTSSELKAIQFYSKDFLDAVEALGSFNAKDPNLFFRQGLIYFKDFGVSIGKIATFLSGNHWDENTQNAFNRFTAHCLSGHQEKSWVELVNQKSICQSDLDRVLNAYFKQDIDWSNEKPIDGNANTQPNVVFHQIGLKIPSFPSTSVLTDLAASQTAEALKAYHENLDRSVALLFKLQEPGHIRFGYWGNQNELLPVSDKLLQSDDAKSKRFLNLGAGTWIEALSTSPAEPGLAPLQPISYFDKMGFSAGGWSDLQPVQFLKAIGCDDVALVTRKGGDSLFAQGIAKQLFNFEKDWSDLWSDSAEGKAKVAEVNAKGDPSDMTSLWSQLFNAANPKSSFSQSIAQATTIICTNWDEFNVKTDLVGLVQDGYDAPWVGENLESEYSHLESFHPNKLQPDFIGCGYTPY